ncbi:GIY-YIG nuclease family protein [Haloarchaeobius salinus]|uniref:GIY-YIG nuclease family protein n=1 Tax=Haloarchaeobius salinus TaxID=1198298 RepID=UPI00210A605F|nr:GIY-YIG nuclease family protein [Haloarchaeobius salinus]
MAGGTYTLLVELDHPVTVDVGALGEVALESGWYGYTGSALGSGGFSRLDRHREVAAGERDVRHWHVDYLLGHDAATVRGDVRTPEDVECAVARRLSDAVAGFGCTDCDCTSHLTRADDGATLRAAVADAHRAASDGV